MELGNRRSALAFHLTLVSEPRDHRERQWDARSRCWRTVSWALIKDPRLGHHHLEDTQVAHCWMTACGPAEGVEQAGVYEMKAQMKALEGVISGQRVTL